MSNPNNPQIGWGSGTPPSPTVNCTAGTQVTVTVSYDYPINILGVVTVAGSALNATAVAVVE
jgi:hypothetical protein